MTTHYCDPDLHHGNTVVADFFVRPREADGFNGPFDPSFSCCARHVAHAIRFVEKAADTKLVEVRDVSDR